MQLEHLHENPSISVSTETILSPLERHHIMQMARRKMERAIGNASLPGPVRSWLRPDDSIAAEQLVERAAALVGLPCVNCEAPEIVYFRRGHAQNNGQAAVTRELLDASAPVDQVSLRHGGQRIVTALVFLQDQQGAAGDYDVEFPALGKSCRVDSGRLLRFANAAADGTATEYVVPAASGERWAAVLRFREERFRLE
jgi:hypothetical protein